MTNHTPQRPGKTRSFPAILGMVALGVIVLFAVFALVGVPMLSEDAVGDDYVAERPTGAGTAPEGEADMLTDGITGQIDEVEPVAPDEDTIPAAERIDSEADAGDEGFVEPEEGGLTEDTDRNPAAVITEETSIDEGTPGNAAID